MKTARLNLTLTPAISLALILSAIGFTGGVQAETSERIYDEIIVTAERMQRSELDTASSITTINAEQIVNRSLESLSDVLNLVPNVNPSISGGSFQIRGIGNTSVTGGGDGGLATIYMDGAPLSQFATTFGPTDTWDIGSIEIFRGAQSTNLGRDSLAGAIVIRSTDPVYGTEYKARVRAEEYGGLTLSAMGNIALTEDTLALRFSVDRKESDGFIDNTTLDTDKYQSSESLLLRGKLLFEPTEDFRNILTVSYTQNKFGDGRISGPDFFERISTANIAANNDVDQFIATWEAEFQINESWEFSNVLSYNKAKYDQISDDDGTDSGGVNARERKSDISIFTEEARFFYNSEKINAAFGVYYAKENEDNFRTIATGIDVGAAVGSEFIGSFYDNPFIISGVDLNGDKTTNYAMFVNVDYDLSSLVTMNIGLRYDHEKKDFNGGRTVSLGSTLPDPATFPAALAPTITLVNGLFESATGANPERVDTNYDAWLPQIGFVFHISDSFTATLQAKRAYRAGGGGTSLILGDYNFDPEYAWTYEAGLRKRFMDGQGLVKLDVYQMEWDDMQVLQLVPSSSGDFFVSNAAKSTLKGFEIEVSLSPTEEWNLFANVGYSDTEFKDFINQAGADLSGNEFPGASHWNAAAGFSWFSAVGWFAQSAVNYQSKAPTNVQNDQFSDKRFIINAKVGYQWNNMQVNIFARNLLDENYVSNTTGNLVSVGAPQVFGIEFQISN